MYTVYHCSSSVDNIVHTRVYIVHTFKAELQCHVIHFYLKHCSCHDRKCGQFSPHFGQIVYTFWGRVHCSPKTLFTYLTEGVDNFVHTFIKLSILSGDELHFHLKNVHIKHSSCDCLVFKHASNCMNLHGHCKKVWTLVSTH
jgi:hypothetical protein